MKLSKHFTLEEFLVSQTASRNGIDMTPPQEVIDNLQRLVTTCMQPLRDEVNVPIFISSGYRPPALNRLIGGSVTSKHMTGEACDFKVTGQEPHATVDLVTQLMLPFDQVIHEFGRWVHLGISANLRCQVLTACWAGNRTVYMPGNHKMEAIV